MRAGCRVNRWATCAVAAAALWCPSGAAAADVGFRGPAFTATSVVKPSGQKPQSKLWFHAGTWWGSLFVPGPDEYRVHRLDPLTHAWVDTGTPLDDRNSSEGDVLWNGTQLYVASSTDSTTSPDPSIRVMRLTYDAAAARFVRDPSYNAVIPSGAVEAVVLDQDTTGRLWLTYTRGNAVYVAHTSGSPADAWAPPYVLPVTDSTGLTADDISAIVAYGGRIGVMWSNQAAQAMYFASHADGAPDSAWTLSTALSGPFMADDHINLKSVQGGPGTRVFAAVKTSNSDDPAGSPTDDQVDLLALNAGAWTTHRFGTVADDHTRPIVLTDQLTRRLYMFATSPDAEAEGDQSIYFKETSLDSPAFAPGLGTAFVHGDARDVNDATSTKQDLSVAPQLVVLASDLTNYWHNTLALSRPQPTPTPTVAPPTPTPTSTVAPPTPTPTPTPTPKPKPKPKPTPTADRAAPGLTDISARPRTFRRRSRTTIRFTLSEPAAVRLGSERAAIGRRVGGRCVRPTRSNRSKRACKRYVLLRAGVTRQAAAGPATIAFRARSFTPGRYRLVVLATDAAGNASAPHRIAVRVLR